MTPWIKADWSVPDHIHAYTTTRELGNLALHVGDDPKDVNQRRIQLTEALNIPSMAWLEQTHSNKVINLNKTVAREADGAYVTGAGQACVVMTGDCLPLLLCDKEGKAVAAVHCGWRGLSQGIIREAVAHFPKDSVLTAWIGPAISAPHYEVDSVVREAFPDDKANPLCFLPNARGRWQASLVQLATEALKRLNVTHITGGEYCTYRDTEQFYSYRRHPQTGRMATIIWIA